jgi:hypothetical protein
MDGSQRRTSSRRRTPQLVLLWAVLLLAPLALDVRDAAAQSYRYGWGGRRRSPPKFPDPNKLLDGRFVFSRIMYESVRREQGGQGWWTDYPGGDINFMTRFEELTEAEVARDEFGRPDHVVVRLTDDELFDYPFIFMSDVGTAGFSAAEAEKLGDYLLRGGFLWVDDFWGNWAWEQWAGEIGKALPSDQYPIFDLTPDHQIFKVLYDVKKVPQITSIQHWRRVGGRSTSERGAESAEVHFRAIADHSGRIMVLMTHNTDIADGWERENEDWEFFDRFSADAYALAINIVLYAMTH